jgi:hypothetical protein
MKNHKRRVKARFEAVLEAADDTTLGEERPYGVQKLIKQLKL